MRGRNRRGVFKASRESIPTSFLLLKLPVIRRKDRSSFTYTKVFFVRKHGGVEQDFPCRIMAAAYSKELPATVIVSIFHESRDRIHGLVSRASWRAFALTRNLLPS